MSSVRAYGCVVTGGVNERKVSVDVSFDNSWVRKGKVWTNSAFNVADASRASAGGGVKVGTDVYIMGGVTTNSGQYDAANRVYHLKPPVGWERKAGMPEGTVNQLMAAVNSDIYAIGGFGYNGANNRNYCYHTLTNTWESKAARPNTAVARGVSVGTDIYMFGGGLTYCYHTLTNTWEVKAAMPHTTGNSIIVAYGTDIYLFGGYAYPTNYYYTYCYHTLTNTWEAKAAMPTELYTPNNSVGGTLLNTIHVLTPTKHGVYNVVENTWGTDVPPNSLDSFPSVVCAEEIDSVLYLAGATSNNAAGFMAYSPTDASRPFLVGGESTMIFSTSVMLNGTIIEPNTKIKAPPNSRVVFLSPTTGEIIEKIDRELTINTL